MYKHCLCVPAHHCIPAHCSSACCPCPLICPCTLAPSSSTDWQLSVPASCALLFLPQSFCWPPIRFPTSWDSWLLGSQHATPKASLVVLGFSATQLAPGWHLSRLLAARVHTGCCCLLLCFAVCARSSLLWCFCSAPLLASTSSAFFNPILLTTMNLSLCTSLPAWPVLPRAAAPPSRALHTPLLIGPYPNLSCCLLLVIGKLHYISA